MTAVPSVTPFPATATVVAPPTKLAPVSVTGTLLPRVPLFGVMLFRTGRLTVPGALITKLNGALVPAEVATEMPRLPSGAFW